MRFVVKRSEWLRGEGAGPSCLLRSGDNKKCCLGFRALACGHSEDEIRDKVFPKKWGEQVGEPMGTKITSVNDIPVGKVNMYDDTFKPIKDDTDREQRLTKLFAQLGDEIVFED